MNFSYGGKILRNLKNLEYIFFHKKVGNFIFLDFVKIMSYKMSTHILNNQIFMNLIQDSQILLTKVMKVRKIILQNLKKMEIVSVLTDQKVCSLKKFSPKKTKLVEFKKDFQTTCPLFWVLWYDFLREITFKALTKSTVCKENMKFFWGKKFNRRTNETQKLETFFESMKFSCNECFQVALNRQKSLKTNWVHRVKAK